MANSRYPVPVGAKNGGNGANLRGLRAGFGWAWGPSQWWYEIFDITRAGTLAAATSQAFDMHTYNPNNLFPANVMREAAVFRVLTNFTGGLISAVTAEGGDAGDPNGLIDAQSVFATAGTVIGTPAAAEYLPRPEASFIPTLTLRTTGANVSAHTGGRLLYGILFRPLVAV